MTQERPPPPSHRRPRFRLDRLSWKLGLSAAGLVIAALAGGFYLVYDHYWQHVVETARSSVLTDSRLIRQALEHQMLRKDRSLIRAMVDSFAEEQSIRGVMILDREGRVRYTSDPAVAQDHFSLEEPTCQVCHDDPPSERADTTTIDLEDGAVLRSVQPILNREACYGCHAPEHRINGVLVVDARVEGIRKDLEENVGTLALGTAFIGLLLLGAIGLVFRRLVVRRLRRFEKTARAIAGGDLEQRVPLGRDDAFTRVESQFNRMADSVVGLLKQLRAQRQRLEDVMNSVDDGVVVLDRSRRVVAVNQAFVQRFAHERDDILGERCSRKPSGEEDVESCRFCATGGRCPTQECFETGAVTRTVRSRTLPDGTLRHEEVHASPVLTRDGVVGHCVEVWRDITDRRSAEARLADYQRLASLGMLASGFSHEVNTPLASVRTCLDAIARHLRNPSELSEADREAIARYVTIGSEQVQRCGAITEQFLRLARGKSLGAEVVDVVDCARKVASVVDSTARQNDVRIEVAAVEGLPAVVANVFALQQVLLNLMLNAVEASEPNQTVHLSFANDGDCVEVNVRDEGAGIPAADLPRIFEPFFTRRATGTGIGLFVSLNLARSWGGDIRVESTPGLGASFTVTFPGAPTGGEV